MFRTLQAKLFFTYSVFILAIIIGFTMFYYVHTARTIEEQASESLHAVAYSLNAQLDSELNSMDSIITKIWYSETFKEMFFTDINSNRSMSLERERALQESVFTAIGPDFPVSRVTIFHPDGNFFSVGLLQEQNHFTKEEMMDLEWVKSTRGNDKKYVILPPHSDEWVVSGAPVISYCKSVDTFIGEEPAVIEVQQDYNRFISIIENLVNTATEDETNKKTVLIYDQNGQIVFPYSEDQDDSKKNRVEMYQQALKENKNMNTIIKVTDTDSREREVVAFDQSQVSGWIVTVSESESALLASVTTFKNTTLFAMAVILIATMILSYFVSKTITIPINKILKNMKRLSLEALPEKDFQVNSKINELEELNQTFSKMCAKLKDSLDEIVLTRSHEIQSRLLAFQAQMNPHFLFNTIANISIMAEDNDDIEVMDACRNLSNMLRFISSKSDAPIDIRQELIHTECFIKLMKIRHENNLELTIDMPENMMDIKIPKLVIEPLVENCTKYAINIDPPWKIKVLGECKDRNWMVSVIDNGSGFDELFLSTFQTKIEEIDLKHLSVSLELGGMGLFNIYVRLKLLYGDDALFRLYNLPQGGAVVQIGGSISRHGEDKSSGY